MLFPDIFQSCAKNVATCCVRHICCSSLYFLRNPCFVSLHYIVPHNFDDIFLWNNLYWYPIICIRHNYWTSLTFKNHKLSHKKIYGLWGKIFWKLSCETSEQMLLQIFAHWPVTITSISDCGERDNYKNDVISRPRVMNIWLFFPSICYNKKTETMK